MVEEIDGMCKDCSHPAGVHNKYGCTVIEVRGLKGGVRQKWKCMCNKTFEVIKDDTRRT